MKTKELNDFIARFYPKYRENHKPYRRQTNNVLTDDYIDLKLAKYMYAQGVNTEFWAREIVKVKRDIRKWLKRETTLNPVCIYSDFDTAVFKYDLGPVEHRTKRQVKHFCADKWTDAPCTQYDCTGKLFTTGMHYGVLHGNWIVWEYVSIDV